jgi:small subunit ribosomal protein S19e
VVTVYDVEADRLIAEAAKRLREAGLSKPDFVGITKTGSHNERPPEQEEFWWVRCASIMRKIYMDSGLGVNKLRRQYGGKRKNGVSPPHFRAAGGKINRVALQQLEKLGLMAKGKDGKGRALTPAGFKFMDSAAKAASKGAASV